MRSSGASPRGPVLIYIKKETGISAQLIYVIRDKGIAHHLPDMRNVPGWQ